MQPQGLSAAAVLDQVKAGTPLQSIADAHPMERLVEAVLEAKRSLRYGVTSLDDNGLHRRAGIEPWSVAEIVGHALRGDDHAHSVARSLALGRVPDPTAFRYDDPGDAAATREALLAGIAAAEARAATALVLAAGGPAFPHRDLGPLSARGWILFIAVHDALHLHQAAAVVRTPR